MGIEGAITLGLHWDGRTLRRAEVRSRRPLAASRLLEGQPWPAAQATVPLLFSICGRAQAVAAAGAIEAALGAAPGEAVALQRELLLAAEMIQEYAWRILLDLPALLGQAPQAEGFAALRRELQGALPPGGVNSAWWCEAATPQGLERWRQVSAGIGALLDRHVYGMAPGAWLELTPGSGPARWLDSGTTAAARALARLWPSPLGRSAVPLLPCRPAGEWALDLGERLAADAAFPAAPTWRGAPAETGALARSAALPLIAAALRDTGNTVALRLLARLAELALLAGRLAGLARGEIGARWSGAAAAGAGAALGTAETARGILLHFVRLDGEGRVTTYRIVAPTEWNFHPQGAFVQGLTGFAAAGADEARRAAGLMAHALDPCVAHRVEVVDA
jgi:coenzyme F420-reducing hydrogenase alpha subunit